MCRIRNLITLKTLLAEPSMKASDTSTEEAILGKKFIINKFLIATDIAAELKTGSKPITDGSTNRARKIKPFKLQEAARRLSNKELKEMLHSTYRRILTSDSKFILQLMVLISF